MAVGADTLSFLATNAPTSSAVCRPMYRRCASCFWYHFSASAVFSGTLRALGTFNAAPLDSAPFLPFSARVGVRGAAAVAAPAPWVYSSPGDSSMCCVGGGMSSGRSAAGDAFCTFCDATYVA